MRSNLPAKLGAVFYGLWGVVHVLGAGLQLNTLKFEGGGALGEMISTASPYDASLEPMPAVAGAFMGMGSFNLLWIGLLVVGIAITMNWRNSPTGYWLNLAVVGATDIGLISFLLLSGTMAWTDGGIGISLFLLAAVLSTIGLLKGGQGQVSSQPAVSRPTPIATE